MTGFTRYSTTVYKYYDFDNLYLLINKHKSIIAGKIIADKIPIWRLLLKFPETKPARVGPPEHPRSPARANIANITVPPLLIAAEDLLNVPGHNTPTENPHKAQPTRPIAGTGINAIHRYEITQRHDEKTYTY